MLGGKQRIVVDMPAAMVDTELIKDAVRSACRAPSLHNSQPWQWVARRGRLELFLGLGRAMVSDRSGREALIGWRSARPPSSGDRRSWVASRSLPIPRSERPESSGVDRFYPDGVRHRQPTEPRQRDLGTPD
jgi:nitroreductase